VEAAQFANYLLNNLIAFNSLIPMAEAEAETIKGQKSVVLKLQSSVANELN
jgi:hypothetical protein